MSVHSLIVKEKQRMMEIKKEKDRGYNDNKPQDRGSNGANRYYDRSSSSRIDERDRERYLN